MNEVTVLSKVYTHENNNQLNTTTQQSLNIKIQQTRGVAARGTAGKICQSV